MVQRATVFSATWFY
jgi:TetR/AcrR family transcriptional repressor of nem operon